MEGVHTVLHFAANMGGMGTIHGDNDFTIYEENHTMTTNLLKACVHAGVKRFFYASSACVYPESLQTDTTADPSLRESDVWLNPPPRPQGLYGLEKLASELLLQQMGSKIDVRMARFHNVYGPGGAWNNGREKAPAAFLRKAIAAKLSGDMTAGAFEVWGDGCQRRSFLWIDDAVDAILVLLESSCTTPVNIGSDESVTVRRLAEIALRYAAFDVDQVKFHFDCDQPIGVGSRNSNNELISSTLPKWKPPTTSLENGMHKTGIWIESEMKKMLEKRDDSAEVFRAFQRSQLVHLQSERITYAILLPITSRGGSSPDECLHNLRRFSHSLNNTTWRDTHSLGGTRYHIRVYLAIDHDDHFLLNPSGGNKAEVILRQEGIPDIVTLTCRHPRGHVCQLWRDCARKAWVDGCQYLSLMGEDVTLLDEGWMRDVHAKFGEFASANSLPFGFGCVAFTDVSFPGMPTFPVIHRTHMDIFGGKVVPDVFINQDGDPFLFQLYRRWGCSAMIQCRISNGVGGETEPRYIKHHIKNWTFEPLDTAVASAEQWLIGRCPTIEKHLTLDIVIPCYRVNLQILATILALKSSSSCSVMFIVIIDNPESPHIIELMNNHAHKSNVRIRKNSTNLGASESRNKGMDESSADWILFLDDDVVPDPSVLVNAEKVIRTHPKAAGFVGKILFPRAESVFTTAVHLAGVTYFWDIATKIDIDVPWGVTANLIARRNIADGVRFDTRYPKTGGGEDIDFCRKKRSYFIEHGGEGFVAAPDVVVTHPWWHNGARSYWRFFMWSTGDGALIGVFPEHSYRDIVPNCAELMLLCLLTASVAIFTGQWSWFIFALKAFTSVVLANVVHDCYRHFWSHPERAKDINSALTGVRWLLAVIESSFIRMFSEVGRLRGMLSRGEIMLLGKRFDWFAGRFSDSPMEEKMSNMQRLVLTVAFLGYLTFPLR